MIKKINASLSLFTACLLLLHMWIMVYSLLTGWYSYPICKTVGIALCVVFSVHAILSIFIFFFCHDGTALSCKKENMGTIMQRAEGILLLLLIHIHTHAYGFIVSGEVPATAQKVLTTAGEIILIYAAVTHTAMSVPKALISLGAVKAEHTRGLLTKIFLIVFGITGLVSAVAVVRFFVIL